MSSEWLRAARALLRAANGIGSGAAQDLWASLASSSAALSRGTPRRWSSAGDEVVLWVAPHPDDEAMGGAGTLMRHARLGDRVCIAVVIDGSRSRALGLDAASMSAMRAQEAGRAAARIGAELRWLDLSEGDWADRAGETALTALLTELRPTVVYAPSSIDFHPEHRRVARALASALDATASTAEVRIYATQVPLTPVLVNVVHDVSDLEDAIRDVLLAYPSQRGSVERTLRLRRYGARFYGGRSQAEGFCALPVETFLELHRRPDAAFRALRIHAWSDPLALAIGARERWGRSRRLARSDRGSR